jgi:hypothetical protein
LGRAPRDGIGLGRDRGIIRCHQPRLLRHRDGDRRPVGQALARDQPAVAKVGVAQSARRDDPRRRQHRPRIAGSSGMVGELQPEHCVLERRRRGGTDQEQGGKDAQANHGPRL